MCLSGEGRRCLEQGRNRGVRGAGVLERGGFSYEGKGSIREGGGGFEFT